MKPSHILLIAAFFMTSCTSLQTNRVIDNRQYHYLEDGRIKMPVMPKGRKECPVYKAPEVISTPPAPIEKFKRIAKSKAADREDVLLDYIEQLRSHISTTSKTQADAYAIYIEACKPE